MAGHAHLLVWSRSRPSPELQGFREAEVAAVLQCLGTSDSVALEPLEAALTGWKLAWLHGCSLETASMLQHRLALSAAVLQVMSSWTAFSC